MVTLQYKEGDLFDVQNLALENKNIAFDKEYIAIFYTDDVENPSQFL